MNRDTHTMVQVQIIQDLSRAIEHFRLKQRDRVRKRAHPKLYRFTLEELCDVVYPSYKNLLYGRTQHIPTRATLMRIADYLECTFDERNDILVAARYMPERQDLKGPKLAAAIDHARKIMQLLPFPALVLTRDWKIHDFNSAFLYIYGITDERQIPKKGKSLFHVTFDKRMPFRERSMVSVAEWQKQAISTITGFKHKNLLFRYEEWYRRRVKQCHALPDFSDFWNDSETSVHSQDDPFTSVLAAGPNGVPIRYTKGLLTLFETGCPTLLVYLPADEAARHLFAQMGCATDWSSSFPSLNEGVS